MAIAVWLLGVFMLGGFSLSIWGILALLRQCLRKLMS